MGTTKTEVAAWPGGGSLKDSIPPGWHMTSEAAAAVGRTADTLRRWKDDGTYEPSGYTTRGELTISLYSDDDINIMRGIAATKKAGRPPKEEAQNEGTG